MMFLETGEIRHEQPQRPRSGESIREQRREMNSGRRIITAMRTWLSTLQEEKRRHRLAGTLAAAICAVGFAIRLYIYFVNRSLWGDEAKLALDLVHRSIRELLLPLDYAQAAPIGFLILEKAVISALGNFDYVLRIVPLLAGLAAVPPMLLLARRSGGGLVPLLSLGLFAFTASLIYYSSELKQYSSDVLGTLVLLLAASRVTDESESTRPLVALGLAGILTMWISHPAVFVLSGVFLTLGLSAIQRRQWRRLLYLIGLGALLAINLGLEYFVSLRQSAHNPLLTEYWQWSFAPPVSPGTAPWYLGAFRGLLEDPVGLPFGVVTSGLFVAGLLSLALRRWQLLVLFTSPILFALLASALRLYPFTGRFLLFGVPMVLIVVAEGVERIRILLTKLHPATAALAAAAGCTFLLYQPLGTTYKWIQSPPLRDHIKPAMAYVSEHHLESDLIYLYYYATPQFQYYAPFYGLDRSPYVEGVYSRDDPAGYLRDINSLIGHARVWFIFSHNYRSGKVDEQRYFLKHLDEIGDKKDEFYSPGVSVFLYDLSRQP